MSKMKKIEGYIKPLKSEMPSFTKQINRINNELIQSNIENVKMIIEEIESTGTYSDIRDFCLKQQYKA